MSELRKDPVLDRWVIIAAERGRRPSDFASPEPEETSSTCPLCEGQEEMTPPEILAVRPDGSAPNTPGWQVRVVPNKFPALTIEGELDRRGMGINDMMRGVGAHEVIIESPQHGWRMSDGPPEAIATVLGVYRQRLLDLYNDPRFRYVVIFRNYGERAGASLRHPHSQLIAVPVTPKRIKDKLVASRDYYRAKERCLFCDIVNQEVALGDRVAASNEHFVALCPFASRFPFELAIFPRSHEHDFALLNDAQLQSLARIMHLCLRHLRSALGEPHYNYVINTAPNAIPRPGRPDYWSTLALDYHWHLEVIPRVTHMAGFEWGTGFYINPVAPEDAAQFLRHSIDDESEAAA